MSTRNVYATTKGIRFYFLTIVLSLSINSIADRAPELTLEGFDVYGTDSLDANAIADEFSSELVLLVSANSAGNFTESTRLREEIAAKLKERGEYAYLDVSSIRYYPPRSGLYVTVDVVEERDAVRRMPFRAEPPESNYEDPDGLLAKWHEYTLILAGLARSGEIDPGECEVLHCIAPFESNAQLAPFLIVFNDGAAKHEELLYKIAGSDSNPYNRARAIFLLAHTNNLNRIMPLLDRSVLDPSLLVRNNAMRIMIMIAQSYPERAFPTETLVAAMDFPATTDRNKALFVVAELAKSDMHREAVRKLAVPTAIRLLRLTQPNNHNGAYELLKAVSGEDFGARNYSAWVSWSEGHR